MQRRSTGLSPSQCTHQAPAADPADSQHHDHYLHATSVCRRPHVDFHAASLQPAAMSSAATAGPDSAQAIQPDTVLTPLSGCHQSAEAQQTYTRRRQTNSAGRQAKCGRPADYAWLQGADASPVTVAQPIRQGLLWWPSEAGQADAVQSSFERCSAAAAISSMSPQSSQDTLVR